MCLLNSLYYITCAEVSLYGLLFLKIQALTPCPTIGKLASHTSQTGRELQYEMKSLAILIYQREKTHNHFVPASRVSSLNKPRSLCRQRKVH